MFLAINKNIHYTTFYIRYLQKDLLLEIGKDHDESRQQSMMGPQVQVRCRPPGACASAAAMGLSQALAWNPARFSDVALLLAGGVLCLSGSLTELVLVSLLTSEM